VSNLGWNELDKLRYSALSQVTHETLSEKYVLLLATRVTELCQDAYNLASSGRVASAPIILRSALESYIDLVCVTKDEAHIDEMNRSFEKFKDEQEGRENKIRLKTIWRKFKIAGEKDAYNGLYAHLCRSSHGNIDSLVRDHADGENISVGHRPDEAEIEMLCKQSLLLSCHTLIVSLEHVGSANAALITLRKFQSRVSGREDA